MWRHIAVSAVGSSHRRDSRGCEDACRCEVVVLPSNAEVLVAVASDGAGSARFGGFGAQSACTFLMNTIRCHLQQGTDPEAIGRETILAWLEALVADLHNQCLGTGTVLSDYACTVLGAVVADVKGIFFQIGDGAIVVPEAGSPGTYKTVIAGQKGEYANETCFVTGNDFRDRMAFAVEMRHLEELAMLTDGLERLALALPSGVPHNPFFTAMLGPLRGASQEYRAALESQLCELLQSDRVNTRTDDDKTLILASRSPEQVLSAECLGSA